METIICGITILFGLVILVKNRRIALKMQEFYIAQAKRGRLDSAKWERPWILSLFRTMVVFVGILIIISAYPLTFGPYSF